MWVASQQQDCPAKPPTALAVNASLPFDPLAGSTQHTLITTQPYQISSWLPSDLSWDQAFPHFKGWEDRWTAALHGLPLHWTPAASTWMASWGHSLLPYQAWAKAWAWAYWGTPCPHTSSEPHPPPHNSGSSLGDPAAYTLDPSAAPAAALRSLQARRPPPPAPAPAHDQPPAVPASLFLNILLLLSALNTLFTLGRAFSFAFAGLKAAERTHDRLLDAVLHATMAFFNSVPTGRTINRWVHTRTHYQ